MSEPVCDLALPDGRSVRLKWHMLRRCEDEAPFKPANLVQGWRAGASLEIDIRVTADRKALVVHDPALGRSTTLRAVVGKVPSARVRGHHFRDAAGRPDTEAPCLLLGELLAHLEGVPPGPGALLQLDVKMRHHERLHEDALADIQAAAGGIAERIVVSSLRPEAARAIAEALPGAAVGYDPLDRFRQVRERTTDPLLMLEHLLATRAGVRWIYLHHPLVTRAAAAGVPLVAELRRAGLLVDVWTIDAGRPEAAATLAAALESGADQITTNGPAALAELVRAGHGDRPG